MQQSFPTGFFVPLKLTLEDIPAHLRPLAKNLQPVKINSEKKVIPAGNKTPPKWWRVTYMKKITGGEKLRKFYNSEAEAKEDILRRILSLGKSGVESLDIPAALRLDALQASKILNGKASLSKAAEFYIRNIGDGRTLNEVVAEVVASKENANRKDSYIRDWSYTIQKFTRGSDDPNKKRIPSFGERPISSITGSQIEKWLNSLKFAPSKKSAGKSLQKISPSTRRNHLRDLKIVFRFACKKKYIGSNPIDEIELPSIDLDPVSVLTLDEVKKLLAATLRRPELNMMIPIAAGLFACARQSEIQALNGKDIHLDKQKITLNTAKKRGRAYRTVDILPPFDAWLLKAGVNLSKWQPPRGTQWRDRFDAIRKEAGMLEDWHENSLRHTSISMLLAKIKDEDEVALQGGTSGDKIQSNYKNIIIDDQDVLDFWSLTPDKVNL